MRSSEVNIGRRDVVQALVPLSDVNITCRATDNAGDCSDRQRLQFALQNPDYFGGINQDDSGEIILELETSETNDVPADMITLDALRVTITGAEIADALPDMRNPDLVQPRQLENNGRVMQGAVLNVAMAIH